MNGYEMTIETLREIAAQSGLAHAEFCIQQTESQLGSDYTKPLWAEFAKLDRERFSDA